MAKRKPGKRKTAKRKGRTTATRARAARAARTTRHRRTGGAKTVKRGGVAQKTARKRSGGVTHAAKPPIRKATRLERVRRTLEEPGLTPPSSLNLDRRGSAVRTGRAGFQDSLNEHTGMTPALTGGDVDADWENAYFSGDEAPGGDNPTPDQEVVDDIGRSLGVEYQDNEELKGAEKVGARDRKRWELDPASSEDYKDRD
jgi:hypothetical protein